MPGRHFYPMTIFIFYSKRTVTKRRGQMSSKSDEHSRSVMKAYTNSQNHLRIKLSLKMDGTTASD